MLQIMGTTFPSSEFSLSIIMVHYGTVFLIYFFLEQLLINCVTVQILSKLTVCVRFWLDFYIWFQGLTATLFNCNIQNYDYSINQNYTKKTVKTHQNFILLLWFEKYLWLLKKIFKNHVKTCTPPVWKKKSHHLDLSKQIDKNFPLDNYCSNYFF